MPENKFFAAYADTDQNHWKKNKFLRCILPSMQIKLIHLDHLAQEVAPKFKILMTFASERFS